MRRGAPYVFAAFFLIASIFLAGLILQSRTGRPVDPLAVARMSLVLVGLGVLMHVALMGARQTRQPLLCPQCGSRIFETRSPESAIPLLTCFGCGLEVQVRPAKRARSEPRPPAPGAA